MMNKSVQNDLSAWRQKDTSVEFCCSVIWIWWARYSEICLHWDGFYCLFLSELFCSVCLAEVPEGVLCNISQACANSIIKLLLKKQMWHEVLLLLTGKANGENTSDGGLLKACSLSDVDIGSIIQQCDRLDERVHLIRCLVERGGEKIRILLF